MLGTASPPTVVVEGMVTPGGTDNNSRKKEPEGKVAATDCKEGTLIVVRYVVLVPIPLLLGYLTILSFSWH